MHLAGVRGYRDDLESDVDVRFVSLVSLRLQMLVQLLELCFVI